MGMSASQARLLSITSRLTNNEFRAQTITNSKLRLATASQEASRDYMDALNSKQLMFMNYDDNGEASKVELTPAVLYDYAPMKNQYILRNASNKILVSNTDATNFVETDNLHDFLDRYGLLEGTETSTRNKIEENPNYTKWQAEEPKQEDFKKPETRYRDNWVEVKNPAWQTWHDSEPQKTDPKYEITPGTPGYHVYVWEKDTSGVGTDLYKMFKKASKSCHDNATQRGWDGCYIHVLEHMLDLELGTGPYGNEADESKYPKTFTTSLGYSTTHADGTDINTSAINSAGMTPWMKPISDYIRDGYEIGGVTQQLMVAEHHIGDKYTDSDGNEQSYPPETDKLLSDYYLPVTDTSTNEGKVQVLLSNYTVNASTGNIELKTLRQKCIDLLYVMRNYKALGVDYNDVMIPIIFSFEQDMSIALAGLNLVDKGYDVPAVPAVIDETQYEDDHKKWVEGEPDKTVMENQPVPYEVEVDDVDAFKKAHDNWQKNKPNEYTSTKESYISDVIVNDQSKAQWYTNLWHALNGSETANAVEYKQLKDSSEYGYKVKETDKSIKYTPFEIIDNNLSSSAEWLKFALEQGIVTMEQAKYTNPSEDSGKAMELTSAGYTWNNITYTSARDFVQQDNQRAIAIAEVKYKKKITEIENQEEKFDQDLKKLDTEHSALQTEYESIKEVLSKNVERSFKAFS